LQLDVVVVERTAKVDAIKRKDRNDGRPGLTWFQGVDNR